MLRELHVPGDVLQSLALERPSDFPALFDSAAAGSLGEYTILAAYSQGVLALRADGGILAEGFAPTQRGFLANLDRWWQAERSPRAHDGPMPFGGGWVLFLTYELAREIEPSLQLPDSTLGWVALALRIRCGLALHHATGRVHAFAEAGCDALLDRLSADALRAAARPHRPQSAPHEVVLGPLREEAPDAFLERVRRTQDHIAAGDLYQANLSRWWRASVQRPGSPAGLYRALRRANPAPFAGLLQWGGFSVLSSSPERLVRAVDGATHTRPIAGTRPRSGVAQREPAEIDAMVASDKERAEHVMLVDLERNDLGRVCERGSVRVEELMRVESYPHVHHIVSKVTGRLRPGTSPADLIRATFPGGTITGCPKHRCMQLIAALEREGRGAYTGSMGYLNLNGDLDLNILIRTMTLTDRMLEFRTGAGIVADSDPSSELAETRAKARGMLAALEDAAVRGAA